MNGKRLGYVDAMKGLSILCIMLLHFEDGVFPEVVNAFVGAFMVTAFYVTTGVVYVQKGTNASVSMVARKRIRQLLVPYVWFSVLILGFDGVLCALGLYSPLTLKKELFYALTFRGIGTLWFLPVLFVAELLFLYSCKRVKRAWTLTGFSILCLVGYNWLQTAGVVGGRSAAQAMWTAPATTVWRIAIAFIVIAGTYHVERVVRLLSAVAWRTAVVGVVLVVVGGVLACVVVVPLEWIWLRTTLSSWSLPYGLLLLFCSARCVAEHDWLIYFGRNSLIVMLTHYSFLLTVCRLLDEYAVGNSGQLYGLSSLLWFLIALGVQIPIISIINKRFGFLIGR